MKYILIPLFTIISLLASGQIENSTAKKQFDDGLVSYNSGFYEAADSLFNLSYSIEPSLDAFYFKTITKGAYREKCEKCEKLKFQTKKAAQKKYFKECLIVDSILHPEFSTKESIFYCQLSMYIGDSADDIRVAYCKQDFQDKSVSFFYIEADSTNRERINPIAHFPDLSKIPANEAIYSKPDAMPEYLGGDEARVNFLCKNLTYPDEAKFNGISGLVVLCFIIDEQGCVKNVRVLKSVHEILDTEAIRVTRLMPQWKPGMENGQPVKTQYCMPVKFTLN
jgi:TonB family protein